jgi:hypothetical protein
MRNKESRRYTILSFLAALLILSPGCSYIMDYIEGQLTDRASFSIEASYNSGAQQVTITWDERGSGDIFAGYEIYITEEKDDEYVGYLLVASQYEFNADIMDDASSTSRSLLENGSTDSFTIDVTPLVTSVKIQYGPGIYFFRVGLIDWDESDEEDRQDDYYSVGCANWYNEPCREINYYNNTDISKISGYAMINIY